MGLRPFYKRPRPPARDKGVFKGKERYGICQFAPIACPDATSSEITAALFALGIEAGIKIGRGCEYEPIKDEFTVVGKSLTTGKAQDFKIIGETVANVIVLSRYLNGGKLDKNNAMLM